MKQRQDTEAEAVCCEVLDSGAEDTDDRDLQKGHLIIANGLRVKITPLLPGYQFQLLTSL